MITIIVIFSALAVLSAGLAYIGTGIYTHFRDKRWAKRRSEYDYCVIPADTLLEEEPTCEPLELSITNPGADAAKSYEVYRTNVEMLRDCEAPIEMVEKPEVEQPKRLASGQIDNPNKLPTFKNTADQYDWFMAKAREQLKLGYTIPDVTGDPRVGEFRDGAEIQPIGMMDLAVKLYHGSRHDVAAAQEAEEINAAIAEQLEAEARFKSARTKVKRK